MGLWLKQDGEFIPVSGGSGGDGPHDHDDYLPLAGGTLTGDLEVNGKLDVGTDFSVEGINVEAGYLRTLDGLPGFPSHSFASDILTGFFLAWPGTIGMDGDLHIYGNTPFKLSATKDTGRYYSRMQAGTGASIVLYSPYDSVNPGDALVECETLKVDGDLQVDGQIGCYFGGDEGNPSIWFAQSDRTGFYALNDQLTVTMGGQWKTAWMPGSMHVNTQLEVNGDVLVGFRIKSEYTRDNPTASGATNVHLSDNGYFYKTTLTRGGPFTPSKLTRSEDVLVKAETATLPPEMETDDGGNILNTAEIEAHDTVQLFDVVTALLAKVKDLSAEIEELKKGA